jgi:hypothetical protein
MVRVTSLPWMCLVKLPQAKLEAEVGTIPKIIEALSVSAFDDSLGVNIDVYSLVQTSPTMV